jgi:plasmid stabilization system protein ParE
MKILVTQRAADEMEAIETYLRVQSPQGARNVQLAMQATFEHIASFPHSGRLQEQGVRKFGVARYPYNIYYAVDEGAKEISIVAVRHTSRAPQFSDT